MYDMEFARYRFGLFEFDLATRELRRNGVLMHLQAQPAQVLACLIQRAGEVVTRDELRQALWGNDTFVDFDHGLNFCISQIRSALKENAAEPTYIRTLPKQGYQFIAPIERVNKDVPQLPGSTALRKTGTRWRTPVVAIPLLVALIISGSLWLQSRNKMRHRPIVAVVRFDNQTGNPAMTLFSDGLTDNLVEQLTSFSNGHFEVIGNAQVLRLPREQRDLKTIEKSLKADYVVFGQVQGQSGRTRILAHLVRLPEQTHLKVARIERDTVDPMSIEAEAAQKIASDFSGILELTPSAQAALPPPANR